MNVYPTKLAFDGDRHLVIDWSDGQKRRYGFRELRDRCPCATCREKHAHDSSSADLLPVISAVEAQPLRVARMNPVGNYAYSVVFSDGHDTGIYTMELLRELGEVVPG